MRRRQLKLLGSSLSVISKRSSLGNLRIDVVAATERVGALEDLVLEARSMFCAGAGEATWGGGNGNVSYLAQVGAIHKLRTFLSQGQSNTSRTA